MAKGRTTAMDSQEGLTWPQIRYWAFAITLGVVGFVMLIGAQFSPWEGLKSVVSEMAVAVMIAGILAGLVEPFFRHEFARDAFLASFRYVLPPELRDEIEKILRIEFIIEKQIWTVEIEKGTEHEGTVKVTTTFERLIRNKTKTKKPLGVWYEADDYNLANGPTRILECSIEEEDDATISEKTTEQATKSHWVEAKTKDISVRPNCRAKLSGKAVQFRRINDSMIESFRYPIINPEIRVIIDEKEFDHVATFGTAQDEKTKSKYDNHYTLSGVYFPNQVMHVRWWPKQRSPIQAP
jgi:hypothetical protein